MSGRERKRATRPIRADVHAHVVRQLAVSPNGRTIDELHVILATQRPASRDTIARVLAALVDEHCATVSREPAWRQAVRVRLLGTRGGKAQRKQRTKRPRGRAAVVYTPTRRLHDLVAHDAPHPSLFLPYSPD